MPSRMASLTFWILTGWPSMNDFAGVGLVNAAEDIHQRGLAGAVFADERDDFTARDLQIHGIQRHDAGKSLGNPAHFKQRRRAHPRQRLMAEEFIQLRFKPGDVVLLDVTRGNE